MISLPIVERELRVAARRSAMYWLRAAVAAFAMLGCLQLFSDTLFINPAVVGKAALQMLSWLGLVLAFFAAVVTADCISSERREGTLVLLFLTTLKSRDVVLGKLAVMGLVAFYAMLGFGPLLMLPLVTGGVTGAEVGRMALVLMNVLFLSLVTGLCVSVHARSQPGAVLGSFGALAIITVVPRMAAALLGNRVSLPLGMFSPYTAFLEADASSYSTNPYAYLSSLAASFLISLLILFMAMFSLRRNWRQVFLSRALKAAAPAARRLIAPARIILTNRDNRRHTYAPIARAVLRMSGQRGMLWLAALIMLTGCIIGAIATRGTGSVAAGAGFSFVFQIASCAIFAMVSGRFFLESRRSGELELLLVTPVGARGILREQRLAMLRLMTGPLYVVLFGGIITAAAMMGLSQGGEIFFLGAGLASIANMMTGVFAVCMAGAWFATRLNNVFAVVGAAVGLVMIAPTAVAYLVPILFIRMGSLFEIWMLLVPVLFVLKNIVFIIWFRRCLQKEFRTRERPMLEKMFRWFAARPSGTIAGEQLQPAP